MAKSRTDSLQILTTYGIWEGVSRESKNNTEDLPSLYFIIYHSILCATGGQAVLHNRHCLSKAPWSHFWKTSQILQTPLAINDQFQHFRLLPQETAAGSQTLSTLDLLIPSIVAAHSSIRPSNRLIIPFRIVMYT